MKIIALKISQVADCHGSQPQVALSAAESVPEFGRCPESGRSSGDNPAVGEVVGGDLEQLRGILEPVDLIEHDSPGTQIFEESLRIIHRPARSRKLAVKVLDVGQRTAKECFAHPSNAGEPDDTLLEPGVLDQ